MAAPSFLNRFIRDADAIPADEYAFFLEAAFNDKDRRPELIAWLAAASARPFSSHVAHCLVQALMRAQLRIRLAEAEQAVNIVGTGGGPRTFNISTAAAFVAAAAGARVLKSGSPAYNSSSGSIDVLRHLGVPFGAGPEQIAESLDRHNLAFVPPSAYSPLLRRIAVSLLPLTVRDIGGIINMVGPMLCPYPVGAQLTGVANGSLLESYADAMRQSGLRSALVVHSETGMDELCSLSLNRIVAVGGAPADMGPVDPAELGCVGKNPEQLAGGAPAVNARIIETLLAGSGSVEQNETVAMNAAAALVLAKKVPHFPQAYGRCMEVLRRGEAAQVLQALRQCASTRSSVAGGRDAA